MIDTLLMQYIEKDIGFFDQEYVNKLEKYKFFNGIFNVLALTYNELFINKNFKN